MVLLIAEKGFESVVILNILLPGLYWANLAILVLQMVGWLSNPFVTALYVMEQAEILFFGGTARASDLRILLSFLVNCVIVVIFTHTDMSTNGDLTVVYAAVAFILSKNYLHTLGLRQPFMIQNEEMARKKSHADVVFANLETIPGTEEQRQREAKYCSAKTMIYNAVGLAFALAVTIVF